MTNTIELLETIGRDASLRHASGEDLSQAIIGLQASEALKLAASKLPIQTKFATRFAEEKAS